MRQVSRGRCRGETLIFKTMMDLDGGEKFLIFFTDFSESLQFSTKLKFFILEMNKFKIVKVKALSPLKQNQVDYMILFLKVDSVSLSLA